MRIIACLSVLAMLFLSACGNTGGAGASATAPASGQPMAQNDISQDSKTLNILTWDGYVPQEVVDSFEQETGIKVNYSNFNTNEEMLTKLQATGGSDYDVIICSDFIIDIMRPQNLIKELDWSKIPNAKNIEPNFQFQYYDPENKYTVPYSAATAILVYDKEATGFEITGYEDLWREELKNSVVLLDGDRDIIGMTLQTLGYSLNETDPGKLEEAKNKLIALKPNIIDLNTNSPHESLISGVAKAGYMFGSQVTEAMKSKPSITYAYPKEGLGFYIDNIVVASKAPNEANAYKFIDYVLDGKNSAKISSTINYINCNTQAKEFLTQEYLDNKTVNIPQEVLSKAEAYRNLGEASKLYNKIWTEFKVS